VVAIAVVVMAGVSKMQNNQTYLSLLYGI